MIYWKKRCKVKGNKKITFWPISIKTFVMYGCIRGVLKVIILFKNPLFFSSYCIINFYKIKIFKISFLFL